MQRYQRLWMLLTAVLDQTDVESIRIKNIEKLSATHLSIIHESDINCFKDMEIYLMGISRSSYVGSVDVSFTPECLQSSCYTNVH